MKELAFYNNHNNLEPLSVRQIEVNPYSSVQDLMTKFVTDLQVNYPATVTTILKTGDKLSLNKHINVHCRLCKVMYFSSILWCKILKHLILGSYTRNW